MCEFGLSIIWCASRSLERFERISNYELLRRLYNLILFHVRVRSGIPFAIKMSIAAQAAAAAAHKIHRTKPKTELVFGESVVSRTIHNLDVNAFLVRFSHFESPKMIERLVCDCDWLRGADCIPRVYSRFCLRVNWISYLDHCSGRVSAMNDWLNRTSVCSTYTDVTRVRSLASNTAAQCCVAYEYRSQCFDIN